MPQPTYGSVHVNAPLTNISIAWLQDPNNFVASQVFPIVPVPKASDVYFVYTQNDFARAEAQQRAPGEESAGSGYGLTTATYTANVWALHKDIADQIRNQADSPLQMDRDATLFLTRQMILRQEIQWAADYFTTGIWGTDKTVTLTWDDPNSDPIGDVRVGVETIEQNSNGYSPNTLVLGRQVFDRLINHPDIVARLAGGATSALPALVNEDLLARILGVKRVLVAKAVKATNKEGQTAAYSYIAGKNALLCYSAPEPGLMAPSAGYTFMWTGVSGGLGENIGISKFRMENLKSDRVEAEIAFADQVVATAMGYFFSSVVA